MLKYFLLKFACVMSSICFAQRATRREEGSRTQTSRGAAVKTLVVYYSLSGNNRLLAKALRERFDCEAYELRPLKPRTKLDLVLDAFLYRTLLSASNAIHTEYFAITFHFL